MFPLKLFKKMSLKFIYKKITLDPDPNCSKIQDPYPNSIYLDLQHWAKGLKDETRTS